jgi:uncharacterized protein YbbC (DUF1343 family)/CubicO group peptidase (beta-lactamase class C family)
MPQEIEYRIQKKEYRRRIAEACVVLCLFFLAAFIANAQGLPVVLPQAAGMSGEKLSQIDAIVEKDIADKKLPGAVVLIGRRGKIVYRKAFGNRSLAPAVEKMTLDTIFDVASLTKVVATTTSIMTLVEKGKLRLNDTVGKFFPEIEDENARRVTVLQLLTHVSGYAPDFDLREKWTGHDGMLKALYKERLRQPPGTRFVYSDIGFIILGEIVWKLTGTNLSRYFFDNVAGPVGMKNSGFLSLDGIDKPVANDHESGLRDQMGRIAPTENIKGQQSYLGGRFEGKDGDKVLRGEVHDPTSYRMNGIAGHAGLFSTADDLARFCQMLLNSGKIDAKRVLSAAMVARMTTPNVVAEDGGARGLGWDINTSFSSNRGELFSYGSFGHTGFTGTSIWIDRVTQTFVVFLSNRVHPDGKGDVTPLRAKVATIAASAVEDVPIEVTRLAESIYQSQIAAQIPRFKEQAANAAAASAARVPRTVTVLNGIDVLERNGFKELNGLRVGLVTNHTGRNLAGRQTIDILKEAPNVKLTALFSPEHGIRGALDEKVSDSTDEKTGLPVYSLYGESRRPKQEQLKDLDALVFDIQDVGSRFYTYISTLQHVMEEAAKAGKPVFVLDRPNPINGVDVEGAVADPDKLTFVATHTLPVRHGMTIGELANMFNVEKKIGADLRVIKMENWSRPMWFDETGQIWVNPSPNMRSLTEAALYTGVGLMEYTNLSVGRGTDTPFEVIGAPWMDGRKLAAALNQKNIPGARFVPVRFTPAASKFKGEECGGINIVITDRQAFRPVRTGLEIAAALRRLFPVDWKPDEYIKLIVNQEIFDRLKAGDTAEELEKASQLKLDEFKRRRAPLLLYK